MAISQEDIAMLIREPSRENRSKIAQKVSRGYSQEGYSEKEKILAEEIFRLLLKDTEKQVRLALAEELKHSMSAPHDVIMALAKDELEIATPVLQFSYILSEEDLIAIVEATREVPRLMAVAARESISLPLSSALIDTGEADVLKRVLRNKGAMVEESSLSYILDEYYAENSVLEELVYRGGLPYQFAERLFSLVGDELKTHLTSRYKLSTKVAEDTISRASDDAMIKKLSPMMNQKDIEIMVHELKAKDKLDYSTLVRALCQGHIRFFETAIAKLVGVPVSNVRLLLMDPGPLGFDSIYASSPLPIAFRDAIKAVFDIALEETNAGNYQLDDFAARVLRQIEKKNYNKTIENMDYLVSIIRRGNHEQSVLH